MLIKNLLQRLSAFEWGPLMWMMPLHLNVNQKSDYDYDDKQMIKVTASNGRMNLGWSVVHKNVQHGKGSPLSSGI